MKRHYLFFTAALLVSAFVLSAFIPTSSLSWPEALQPLGRLGVEPRAPLLETDLAISMIDTADPVVVGDTVTYVVTITNSGANGSGQITLTDTLPQGTVFVSSTPGPTTCNYESGSHRVICTLNPIAPNGSTQVSITVDTSGLPVEITNFAQVTHVDGDPAPANDSTDETTTLVAGTDLSIVKTDSPDPVLAGTSLTYTLTVTNLGPAGAAGVSVSETLPGVLTHISSPGCTYQSGTVTCALGNMAAGASREVTITALVAADYSGIINNIAYVSSTTTDNQGGNNSSQQSTTVQAQADLGIGKTANPTTAVAGSPLTYQITVTNAGPSNAAGVTVVDTLPLAVTFSNYTSSFFTCSHNAGVVSCTASGSLPANASRTITINVNVLTNASNSITNQAVVDSTTYDPVENNDTVSLTTPVSVSANVGITKTASPTPAVAGSPLTYQLTITNAGPSNAAGVTVVDTLPQAVTFTSYSSGFFTCTHTAGVVTCTSASSLPVNSPRTINITVQVDAGASGSITNGAVVSTTTTDPVADNDTVSLVTPISTSANLGIEKTANPATAVAGSPLVYQLTVTNAGPGNAAGVTVIDTLPQGVTFTSYASSHFTCTHSAGVVACDLIETSLPVSAPRTLEITVQVAAGTSGSLTNLAEVNASTPDPSPANDTDSLITPVSSSANLGITKTATPATAVAGSTLAYRLTITNAGPSTTAGVTVTDTLPQGVTFTSYTSSFFTCTHEAGVVACTSGGNLPVNSPRIVNINVQVSAGASGSITNQAVVEAPTPDPVAENNTVSLVTPVSTPANLGITKTANPATAVAGSPLTYQLTVTNAGPSNATGVVVTDTLPSNVTFTSYTSSHFTCAHAAGVVSCDLIEASLPVSAPGTVIITVQVLATAAGSITNQAAVGATTNDPVIDNNSVSLDTPVGTSANVGITKTANPATAVAGSPLTYQLTVTNAGPSIATGVTVVDTLPSGVTFSSYTSSSFTCTHTNGVVNCTLSAATLPVNTPRTINITVRVGASITTAQTNAASVNTTTSDPVQANNTVSLVTPVTTSADLWIDKSANPAALAPGATLDYVIEVHNNFGPSDARDVTVTDALPAQVQYQAIDSSQGSCTGTQNITCNLGTISFGATASVTITVVVNDNIPFNTTFENTARVATTTTPDPNSANNAYTESVIVSNRIINLIVDITDTPDPIPAGTRLTYTILVNNDGPSSATNVILTDTLPSTVSFVSSNPGSPTCTHSAGTLTCNLGGIAARASRTVTVQVDVPPGGSGVLETKATASASEDDQFPDDSTEVAEATQVVASADLAVDVADQPESVIAGNNLQYQVTVSNQGPSNASNTSLAFTLPAGVTFLNSVPGTPACALQSGVLNCSLGTINRNASLQVTVNVRVNPSTTANLNSRATVTSAATDPHAADNTANETTIVTPFADLQLNISDTPDPVRNGASLTYSLRVTNAGPSDAVNLTLVNTLPDEINLNATITISPACSRSGRTVTCSLAGLAAGAVWQVSIASQVVAGATGDLVDQANVSASTSDLSTANNSAQATTAVDRQPPTLTWVSPGPHGGYYRVGPIVHLEVVVADDVSADRVTFALWDRVSRWIPLYTDTTAPFSMDLDTRSIPGDWNEIGAIAYDKAGRVSGVYETDWIFIFVSRYIFMPFTTH